MFERTKTLIETALLPSESRKIVLEAQRLLAKDQIRKLARQIDADTGVAITTDSLPDGRTLLITSGDCVRIKFAAKETGDEKIIAGRVGSILSRRIADAYDLRFEQLNQILPEMSRYLPHLKGKTVELNGLNLRTVDSV